MAKYTFSNLAEEALVIAQKAMTPQEIWELAKNKGFDKKLTSNGQTPWATLGARLFVGTRDDPDTAFTKEGKRPVKFYLKDIEKSRLSVKKQAEQDIASTLPTSNLNLDVLDEDATVEAAKPRVSKYPYKERELHPFVTRFAHFSFKGVYTKTIFHENSSKKNYTEWLHPDLVGFWFPFKDYNKELLSLSGQGLSIARFYSFELKRELTFSNLRESFFQAVSNSSWAHEGYLIAANIDESDALREELSRLSGSFGIGVIELDLADPQSSTVLFPAKVKETIDWNGANKLAKENPDFQKFLADVFIDISNARVHEAEFDTIPTLENLSGLWTKWNSDK